MRTEAAPKTIYLKDYMSPNFTVRSLELNFSIDDSGALVTSKAVYHRENADARNLVLDGECMELLSVSLDETVLSSDRYQIAEHTLTVFDVPNDFTLEVVTKFDPAANTALEGLYKSGDTYCTQCEAQGFRRITYFQDRPDVMTIFTTRIEASKSLCPVLLSNGNLIEEGDLDGGRHYAIWHDPFAKPCYLFALVTGKLEFIQDHFVTRSGRKVDLRIYVREGDQPQCYHAMESLKKSMKWDEDVFGREYDLDIFMIVAVSDSTFVTVTRPRSIAS